MAKVIRKKLPAEYSIGILLLIFGLTYFLSGRLFESPEIDHEPSLYLGMTLASIVVTVMVLILWEELLFPIKINPTADEVIFRNHRNKLKIQLFIYMIIPAIVGFLFINFEVNYYSFLPWAAVCLIAPVAGKLSSGINNYNDFLKLSPDEIEYKNNEKEGLLLTHQIRSLNLIKDKDGFLSKLEVKFVQDSPVVIDLDEMELEEFYDYIEEYMALHYGTLMA